MAGWELDEALLKDIGVSDYVAIIINIPIYTYLKRIILENWIIRLVKARVLPFNVLFEEMILNDLVKTPVDFKKIISRGQNAGILDSDTAHEFREALYFVAEPNPTLTTGSNKVRYNFKQDLVYIGLIISIVVLFMCYDIVLGLTACLPAFFLLVFLIDRLNSYGSTSWLEVSSKGIFFGKYNELVPWDQIIKIDVKKQTDKHYKVKPFILLFHFDNDTNYECDIKTYQGGWRKVYRVIKSYSPVPVDINVVDNS